MLVQSFLSSFLMMLILAFPFLSHPLAMGLNLLFMTIFISLISGVSSMSFWLSYTLMLILSGGLLVIFIYVSLLASNEIFKPKMYFSVFLFIIFLFIIMINFFKTDFTNFDLNQNFLTHIYKLYSFELYQFTIFMVFYLLVTLLVVVYNTKVDKFPLRSFK